MKKQLLLFILTMLPMLAIADDSGSCGDNVTYTFVSSTGTLTIQGSGAMKDYSSSFDPWKYYRANIKTVIIEEGVTSIGNFAFRDCSKLTSITIPNSVTSIGYAAYSGCSKLASITIPNSVTSIGDHAFYGCTNLTSVTIPNSVTSIGSRAFKYSPWWNNYSADPANQYGNIIYINDIAYEAVNTSITSCEFKEGTISIGNYAFWGCSGLTSVTISNSVTSIGSDAFEDCSGLISVTIPNSVTSIGSGAFKNCSGLQKVIVPDIAAWCGISFADSFTDNSANPLNYAHHIYSDENTEITDLVIPDGVTSIGYKAFSGCSGLTSVTIPNSVTSIGYSAFSGCSGLQKVIVPDIAAWCGISFAYNSANPLYYAHHIYSDENTEIKELVIPDGVTGIGWNAFSDCSGLTSVTIPNSVTNIGDYAFEYCSGLTSITIPNSVTSIGYDAFYNCSGLTSVTIGNSVTSIGSSAFEGCSGLTSVEFHCPQIGSWFNAMTSIKEVVIGNEVTSIGERAFSGCSGLTYITIPNSVTSIGYYAFSGCSGLTSITIGNSVTSISNSAFSGCSGLTTVEFHCAQIGSWFNEMTSIKEVVIGNEVTSIGQSAFNGCSGLQKVIVPDIAAWCAIRFYDNPLYYVHHIYSDANTEIKDLVIPNSVTKIEYKAFSGCSGLTSVTIPNSVTSIGDYAFEGCSGLTSVIIGNSVTSIGYQAFEGCSGLSSVEFHCAQIGSWFNEMTSIKEVVIGNEVTSIGQSAFNGCSGLQKVIVPDIAAWCGIRFANEVSNPLFYAHHLYSDENTEIKELVIPDGVTSIGGYAFEGCSGLTSVTIGNSVTSIGQSAFNGCSGLQKVIVPDIAAWCGINFTNNSANPLNIVHHIYSDENTEITEIVIPEGVKKIGQYAFYSCEDITSVTIPSSVTYIGSYAFSCGIKLSEVNVNMNIPIEIDESVFEFTGENYSKDIIYLAATLNVPIGSKALYSNVEGWKKFANIQETEFTGVETIKQKSTPTSYYSVSGEKLNNVHHGINIIRMSDGTTRKVVVK